VLTPSRAAGGFTLVELLIGLAILGFLLALGVPAFSTLLQNQRLRASAETLMNALQLARAEAVNRNGQVQFVLTEDDAVALEVNAITESTTGKNWMVRARNPVTGLWDFVEGKNAAAGTGSTTATVSVSGTVATITFNGLGTTDLAANSTFQVTNPPGGACAPSGPMRCLNVVLTPGGQAKMCDPAVSAAGDTRKC
jgi:type IV fimbrial biogenesis protein FimT